MYDIPSRQIFFGRPVADPTIMCDSELQLQGLWAPLCQVFVHSRYLLKGSLVPDAWLGYKCIFYALNKPYILSEDRFLQFPVVYFTF